MQARLADGASATTINRSLEVVRTILNRAARSFRDPDGRPWLEGLPPLITMLPENPRLPYPITWQEQEALFRRLPPHLARMALFTINTGLRDSNSSSRIENQVLLGYVGLQQSVASCRRRRVTVRVPLRLSTRLACLSRWPTSALA